VVCPPGRSRRPARRIRRRASWGWASDLLAPGRMPDSVRRAERRSGRTGPAAPELDRHRAAITDGRGRAPATAVRRHRSGRARAGPDPSWCSPTTPSGATRRACSCCTTCCGSIHGPLLAVATVRREDLARRIHCTSLDELAVADRLTQIVLERLSEAETAALAQELGRRGRRGRSGPVRGHGRQPALHRGVGAPAGRRRAARPR
jgi:hypothetical protein